jgi:hypothetical protein
MYTPYLNTAVVDAHVDDLRRTMTESSRRSRAKSRSGRARRRSPSTNAIRAFVARLAQ